VTIHGAIIEPVKEFLHLGFKTIRMKVIFMKLQKLNWYVKFTSHCYQYLNAKMYIDLQKQNYARLHYIMVVRAGISIPYLKCLSIRMQEMY